MQRVSPDATLKALDEAGLDVRAWCFRCARGERVDTIVWRLFEARGWPVELGAAAGRFRCLECGLSDQVLLVPATRPRTLEDPVTAVVAAFFHGQRSKRKRAIGDAKRRPR